MGQEIERKFLVFEEGLPELVGGVEIWQSYIPSEQTVRLRVAGETGYLTIKGARSGISRAEFEYEVPLADAREMLETLCLKPCVHKTRYKLTHEGHVWEVDVFHDLNEGLIVAEVELDSEDEEVVLPSWVKEEVSKEGRYTNSALRAKPWSSWK
jgi:adenylate cyclase